MPQARTDGRQPDQLREIEFQLDYTRYAPGSVLASFGETKVLCTATIDSRVPRFLVDSGSGWLTAEYRMLPGATHERSRREMTNLSGRTQEIQRLIGRSLRAAIDLKKLGEKTITIDADVIQADGGTRTTAITGGYVALAHAVKKLVSRGELEENPLVSNIAAISVGIVDDRPLLDLNYDEDNAASVDFNVVMKGDLSLIEVQGTAEENSFTRTQLNNILDLAEIGVKKLLEYQQKTLE